YNVVPPPAADLYRSLKKDLSWTGLPEFADDTVTDYSRRRVQRETTRSQNHAYKSPSHRSYGAPMRPSHEPVGHRPHGPPTRPMRSNMNGARPKRTSADVQASACWVWKSIKPNSASIILKRYDYVDVRGRSSLGEDCWDLRAFNSRNLIADAASSLGEDCWELNVRSIPTSSDVFPLPEEVPTGSAK
nr:hypothetical protein [Tanacetum cinerariifolium]